MFSKRSTLLSIGIFIVLVNFVNANSNSSTILSSTFIQNGILSSTNVNNTIYQPLASYPLENNYHGTNVNNTIYPRVLNHTTKPSNISKLNHGWCYKEVTVQSILKHGQSPFMGNGSNPTLVKIPACCKGYSKYKHNKRKCVPDCSNCKNGFCIAPNQCQCFPGHVKSLDNECVNTCPLGCLNGKCHSNGTCFCKPGYKYPSLSNQAFCVPHCPNGCGLNQNCTAPNRCECSKGYKMNITSLLCEPVCDPPCGQGKCIAPGTCQCQIGYKLIDRTCQANCTRGCENGRCVTNENCICDAGWYLNSDKNKCIPVCTNCQHGTCVGPEECRCHKGYKKEGNECKPHCSSNCRHGKCVKPEYCECNFPYVPSSSHKKCIKKPSNSITVIHHHDQKAGRIIVPAPVVVSNSNSKPRPHYDHPRHTTPRPSYHTTRRPSYNTTRRSYHTTRRSSYHTTRRPSYNTTRRSSYHTTRRPSHRTTHRTPRRPIYRTTKKS